MAGKAVPQCGFCRESGLEGEVPEMKPTSNNQPDIWERKIDVGESVNDILAELPNSHAQAGPH